LAIECRGQDAETAGDNRAFDGADQQGADGSECQDIEVSGIATNTAASKKPNNPPDIIPRLPQDLMQLPTSWIAPGLSLSTWR